MGKHRTMTSREVRLREECAKAQIGIQNQMKEVLFAFDQLRGELGMLQGTLAKGIQADKAYLNANVSEDCAAEVHKRGETQTRFVGPVAGH